jgi:uncharacterized protein YprB with RNaseH-like and TPR domain
MDYTSRYLKLLPTTDETDETRSTRPDETWGAPDETSDETSDDTQTTTQNTNVSEGFVGNVDSRTGKSNTSEAPQAVNGFRRTPDLSSEGFVGQVGESTAYCLITDPSQLPAVQQALDESTMVGLDLETTGLDPRRDRVRLLSLATDRGTWLIDCFAVDPAPLFDLLAERILVTHHGAFDLAFLTGLGFPPAQA